MQKRAGGRPAGDARSGRLLIVPDDEQSAGSRASQIPDLPIEYIGTSDAQLVTSHKAHRQDQSQIASDRREGRCLVSYKTAGGWVAITKAVLSEVLEARHDAKLTGLPRSAVASLKLMYPDLIVLPAGLPADQV